MSFINGSPIVRFLPVLHTLPTVLRNLGTSFETTVYVCNTGVLGPGKFDTIAVDHKNGGIFRADRHPGFFGAVDSHGVAPDPMAKNGFSLRLTARERARANHCSFLPEGWWISGLERPVGIDDGAIARAVNGFGRHLSTSLSKCLSQGKIADDKLAHAVKGALTVFQRLNDEPESLLPAFGAIQGIYACIIANRALASLKLDLALGAK